MSKSNKTTENDNSVEQFVSLIEDSEKREDSIRIIQMMKEISGEEPKMWGSSIIGFGKYHYKYDSGREGDFMKIGFSPRKQNLTLYIMPGFKRYEEILSQLGKHSIGKSCLYIKKLAYVDQRHLYELMKTSYEYMTNKYG